MRIRNGFVSNSSSSSFILLVKETNQECECCGVKINLLSLMDYYKFYDSELLLRGIYDFEDKIKDLQKEHNRLYSHNLKDDGESYEQKEIKIYNDAIKKANENTDCHLIEIEVSFHDEFLNSLMESLIKTNKVIVLSKRNN